MAEDGVSRKTSRCEVRNPGMAGPWRAWETPGRAQTNVASIFPLIDDAGDRHEAGFSELSTVDKRSPLRIRLHARMMTPRAAALSTVERHGEAAGRPKAGGRSLVRR